MTLLDEDLKSGQLIRPYLFMVEMPNIDTSAKITAFLREASMPGYGDNGERDNVWELTFLNDELQKLRYSFIKWLTETKYYCSDPQKYKSNDTKIHQLDRIGSIINTCSFIGLFPIGVSSIKFSHEFNEYQTFSVYFSYDDFDMKFTPQVELFDRDLKESQETNKETSNV